MKKIIVMSGKGGVGKSTIAVNLAYALAKKDYKVGLLDADIHGPTIPKLLGIENAKVEAEGNKLKPVDVEGVKVISIGFFLPSRETPVVWRGPLKHKFIEQIVNDVNWGKLDFLVVDSPPGTGDELISVAQLLEPEIALIVTTPQNVAIEDVMKAVNFAKKMNAKVFVIENMSGFVCPHCGNVIYIFGKGGGERLARNFNVKFLGSIPLDVKVMESGEKGYPFVREEGETSKVFMDVTDRLLSEI
ncbi:MAG: ATP-binding protein [Archaeoglobales archaeon]|nr:MAG: ATP-binding protein [Archaeoglobales archaeon]